MESKFFNEWIRPVLLGLAVVGITWILKEFWGNIEMKHIISFLITFLPIIVGLFAFFLYWVVRDYLKMRRFNNKLEKWIGLFSYKDSKGHYSDLKGKIKRYIREELENDTTIRK